MNKARIFRMLILFIGMMAMGLGVGVYFANYYQSRKVPDIQGLLWPDPKQLRAFATIDQSGQVFGLDRLQGKWSFLFFGYTHCPDVCPLTISMFNDLYRQIHESAGDTQMIFVTLDPERDTSEKLRQYVTYFNPDFIGLGGNMQQIMSLTSQVGVAFLYGEKSATGDYIVDHTASVFLVDTEGRVVAVFTAPHQVDSIRERYKMIRNFIEHQAHA